jgi:hypothetical protein
MEPESVLESERDRDYLKALTAGFIHHLRTQMSRRQPPTASENAGEALMGMAEFVAILRARTKRDKDTDEYIKSRVEVPTRLISQFTKAAICLAIVLERREVDEEVLRICRKLTFDTLDSPQLDIVKVLHDKGLHSGLPCRTIGAHLKLSESAVINYLKHMRYFGVVDQLAKSNNSGQRGRDVHHWVLSDTIKEVYALSLEPKDRKPTVRKSTTPTRPKPKVKS